MKLWVTVIFLGVLPVLSAGCGGSKEGPLRLTVRGTVSLDGQPLESGSILFVDPAGQIQSYFASVKNGAYQTEMEAGAWDVQITAIRELKDKMVPDGAGTGMVPASEQYLPARYNEKTGLRIDVKPGEKNEFPFQLTSQ